MDEISERAKRAWREGKKRRVVRERPSLTRSEMVEFLRLISEIASPFEFERKLGLSQSDVNYYREKLEVENPDDARRKRMKMEAENAEMAESKAYEESKRQKEAAEVANARLREMNEALAQQALERSNVEIDGNAIRQEDAERQRRFAAQQSRASKPKKDWQLAVHGSKANQADQIELFARDIQYRGIQFTCSKYSATPDQIRFEAQRLGLNIDWDNVRR